MATQCRSLFRYRSDFMKNHPNLIMENAETVYILGIIGPHLAVVFSRERWAGSRSSGSRWPCFNQFLESDLERLQTTMMITRINIRMMIHHGKGSFSPDTVIGTSVECPPYITVTSVSPAFNGVSKDGLKEKSDSFPSYSTITCDPSLYVIRMDRTCPLLRRRSCQEIPTQRSL